MEKEFVFNDLNEEVTQKLSTYYSDVAKGCKKRLAA